ncbi:hypothetical protein XAC3218_1300006 [Xanthomonas citri pv. citri]|nr:hypothetical protein XAC3824_1130006 [Xanthomonas citri pv. citri]CEE51642.1 hypothetical protein XAC71A_1320012 [Xanthomonas citri pv. citri]CEE77445.1 hypothetical protein XAC3218_1300006 [Xanthomonas citri pv. citri]CEH82776.1 hypothetical protein XACB302_10560006 [Xanthomonas citri pv. citri]CEI13533.1 hypothetical protein XACG115_3370006 [Xanthomonas citri pv. citri]
MGRAGIAQRPTGFHVTSDQQPLRVLRQLTSLNVGCEPRRAVGGVGPIAKMVDHRICDHAEDNRERHEDRAQAQHGSDRIFGTEANHIGQQLGAKAEHKHHEHGDDQHAENVFGSPEGTYHDSNDGPNRIAGGGPQHVAEGTPGNHVLDSSPEHHMTTPPRGSG